MLKSIHLQDADGGPTTPATAIMWSNSSIVSNLMAKVQESMHPHTCGRPLWEEPEIAQPQHQLNYGTPTTTTPPHLEITQVLVVGASPALNNSKAIRHFAVLEWIETSILDTDDPINPLNIER